MGDALGLASLASMVSLSGIGLLVRSAGLFSALSSDSNSWESVIPSLVFGGGGGSVIPSSVFGGGGFGVPSGGGGRSVGELSGLVGPTLFEFPFTEVYATRLLSPVMLIEEFALLAAGLGGTSAASVNPGMFASRSMVDVSVGMRVRVEAEELFLPPRWDRPPGCRRPVPLVGWGMGLPDPVVKARLGVLYGLFAGMVW